MYQGQSWRRGCESYLWSSAVSSVASQQEGADFRPDPASCGLAVQLLHVRPISARGFLPQSKHGQVAGGVNRTPSCLKMWMWLSLFVRPEIGNLSPAGVSSIYEEFNHVIFFICWNGHIWLTYLISSLSRQSLHSDLLNTQFLPLWHSPLLHYKVPFLTSAYDWLSYTNKDVPAPVSVSG